MGSSAQVPFSEMDIHSQRDYLLDEARQILANPFVSSPNALDWAKRVLPKYEQPLPPEPDSSIIGNIQETLDADFRSFKTGASAAVTGIQTAEIKTLLIPGAIIIAVLYLVLKIKG